MGLIDRVSRAAQLIIQHTAFLSKIKQHDQKTTIRTSAYPSNIQGIEMIAVGTVWRQKDASGAWDLMTLPTVTVATPDSTITIIRTPT